MTNHAFASWVGPVAAQLREGRAEISKVARSVRVEAWSLTSPTGGWTYRDLLVHLSVGDWLFQTVLRAVISKEALDRSLFASINGRNERYRQERAGRTVEELIAEVEAEGASTQALLTRLGEPDEERQIRDAPTTLGEYLRRFPGHDQQHLAELRTALEK